MLHLKINSHNFFDSLCLFSAAVIMVSVLNVEIKTLMDVGLHFTELLCDQFKNGCDTILEQISQFVTWFVWAIFYFILFSHRISTLFFKLWCFCANTWSVVLSIRHCFDISYINRSFTNRKAYPNKSTHIHTVCWANKSKPSFECLFWCPFLFVLVRCFFSEGKSNDKKKTNRSICVRLFNVHRNNVGFFVIFL